MNGRARSDAYVKLISKRNLQEKLIEIISNFIYRDYCDYSQRRFTEIMQ